MAPPTLKEENKSATSTARDAFEVHRQMVVSLFFATFCLSLVFGCALFFSSITALMAVAAAGALGGFVSALRRLYAFQRVFPSDLLASWPRRANLYLVVYSMIPPLVGAIASVTLYVVFAAGLVQGDLFPEFHLSPLNLKPDDFDNFVNNWQPIAPTDYAKALAWGFISGFSERFVPDILGRLSNREGEESKPTES